MVVTIDGPAASGKSTVSRELAKRLGWKWVSTGAFYRGLAYVALQTNVDLDDINSLKELTHSSVWNVSMESDRTRVYFKNQDVTDQIAHEDVGSFASRISHYPEVRKALLDSQRNCSQGPHGLVAEGRDCGTVVFPQAQAKVYLTASSEHRAARRAAEQGSSQAEITKPRAPRRSWRIVRVSGSSSWLEINFASIRSSSAARSRMRRTDLRISGSRFDAALAWRWVAISRTAVTGPPSS